MSSGIQRNYGSLEEDEILSRDGSSAGERRLPLADLLLVLFGISSWVAVNGVWAELPLLVAALPEGWALPSYLSVIVQLANLGPVLYSVLRARLNGRASRLDVVAVYTMVTVGAAACLLSGLLWRRTSVIGGTSHSTALFTLVFFIALVDCTSSVVYVPYTARFKHGYLVSYMIGEGLSGLLPSLVALIQGVGGNAECVNGTGPNGSVVPVPAELQPRFAVDDFFYFLCSMMVVSGVAFALLQHLPRLAPAREPADGAAAVGEPAAAAGCPLPPPGPATPVALSAMAPLLLLQAAISLLANGVLPSVQSYSVLPYGNVAFHLVATLSLMANPAACLVLYAAPVRRPVVAAGWAALGGLCAVYLLVTAALSPTPPLQGTAAGQALVVLGWVLFVGLTTYSKVGIASLLRPYGGRALFWYGAATQAGSTLGALAAFLAVNVFDAFQGYYPC
ncbi:solute carrier family 52, riboflavin transporter, member 3-A-like isoform X1 [Amphibalanus amphitrite]|uniref:solute carrier family 52, riboflavin transporter, member 3-A-like isoform X1 n=1 Tax=Amphibalanus amphitrite TaxID=1232801 RepID=UPI001C901C4D|nr:solute carrier family 52, riboflavin transporter, member 3-A-like isoform X1 [Amphibalanus amphitrite]